MAFGVIIEMPPAGSRLSKVLVVWYFDVVLPLPGCLLACCLAILVCCLAFPARLRLGDRD